MKKYIIEQAETEYIEVSASDYLELMEQFDYQSKVVYKYLTKEPDKRNKLLWIIGDLNLSDKPVRALFGIDGIKGSLDISNTKISTLGDIQVAKYIHDSGTPLRKIKEQRIKNQKLSDAKSRREDNDWDINNEYIDEVGILANVVFEYIKEKHDVRTPEDNAELNELTETMERLLQLEAQYNEEGNDTTDIIANIQATEEEIEVITNKVDLYDLIPNGNHYNLTAFEIVSGKLENYEYAAGTEEDASESLKIYYEDMIDNPQEYFQPSFLEDFIDEDKVLEVIKEHYEYDISDSPESYFDLNDFKLTDEQEEEKERLENELYENQDKLNEYEEGSAEYEQIQEHIDYLEEQISEIEPDTEPTQEMIDEKVDDMLDEVRRNLVGEMENFGMSINNYLDTEKLLESLVSDGDYGHLNHWNNEYDIIHLNNVGYIVMNINQ
jgi:hypothetical protein